MHRQSQPPLRTPTTHVRRVGGEILCATTTTTSVGRIEMLSRQVREPQVEWQFCQPELTLFWHREGFHRMHGWIDDRHVDCDFAGGANLSVFAPEARIRAAFDTNHACSYVAVFFDTDLARKRYGIRPTRNRVGFHSDVLRRALADICAQAACPDGLFPLYAEGWALQALVHVSRIGRSTVASHAARGGLPAATVSRIESYIKDNMSSEITLPALARLAALSERQFLRAFSQSLGTTPHRYVLSHRIDVAKKKLAVRGLAITEIAFECGFTHAQHFSTAFQRMTGQTPSRYRQQVLGFRAADPGHDAMKGKCITPTISGAR